MKILICEDEIVSALYLKDVLININSKIEVSIANTLFEAIKNLNEHEYDALFLDIELGKNNSFELFEVFDFKKLNVVFVSSHQDFAYKAFKVEAIDFILKPISELSIINALNKINEHVKHSGSFPINEVQKILIWEKDKYITVDSQEIIKIKSSNQYTTVFFNSTKSIMQSSSLKDFEEKLNENEFVRIHDSCIINLKYVISYYPGLNSRVELFNGDIEKISRRRKNIFLKKFKNS